MRAIYKFEDFINEGRSSYDGLASKLTSLVFKAWIKGYQNGMSEINYMDQIEDKLEFDLDATIYIDKRFKGFEVLEGTGADARDIDDDDDDQTPFINIYFGINPEWLPGEWPMVYFHLADVMRHEMEHITQDGAGVGNYRAGKPSEEATNSVVNNFGLAPDSESLIVALKVTDSFDAKAKFEAIVE